MRIAERSARAWAAGGRQPENPGEVARAIVAVARKAGLGLPPDEHLRDEQICGELPRRAAAVQCLIVIAVGALVQRYRGVRAFARAMAAEDGSHCESTVRRWLGLAESEPRLITELNRIVARLSRFSRSEIRKAGRRIQRMAGPTGDRQAVFAHISLLSGYDKPVVPTPDETLVVLLTVVAARLLVALACQIAEQLGKHIYAPGGPSSMPARVTGRKVG